MAESVEEVVADAIFWYPLIAGADICLPPQFLLRRFGAMGPWFRAVRVIDYVALGCGGGMVLC